MSQEGQLKYNADQNNILWSNWQQLISNQNSEEKDCATMIVEGDWRVEDCQAQEFKFICAEKHKNVQWNIWQEWSSCSKSCGRGYETRIRAESSLIDFVKTDFGK